MHSLKSTEKQLVLFFHLSLESIKIWCPNFKRASSPFNQEFVGKKRISLVVEDSKSSVVAGKYAIEKLIKKYKVSQSLEGIEPSSATAYFEEILSGRQVMYISWQKIISNNEKSKSLPFEIAGSVESEVRSIF